VAAVLCVTLALALSLPNFLFWKILNSVVHVSLVPPSTLFDIVFLNPYLSTHPLLDDLVPCSIRLSYGRHVLLQKFAPNDTLLPALFDDCRDVPLDRIYFRGAPCGVLVRNLRVTVSGLTLNGFGSPSPLFPV